MRKPLLALCCLLLSASARARDPADADFEALGPEITEGKPEPSWGVAIQQKLTMGNQGYKGSDSTLDIDLPAGFFLSLNAHVYETIHSSMSPTFTFGGGASWDEFTLRASYAMTTRANDEQSRAMEVGASVNTTSRDFRTTLSATINQTRYSQYTRRPTHTVQFDLTARTTTVGLSQRFWYTTVSVDLSESKYNQPLGRLARRGFLRLPGFGSLSGVLSSLPARSDRWGIFQEFGDFPMTLWATYENVHLVNVEPTDNQTSDSTAVGLDADFPLAVNATLSYNYVRQTAAGPTNLYSLLLGIRF